jgi:Protein of unknown function (DUF2637)
MPTTHTTALAAQAGGTPTPTPQPMRSTGDASVQAADAWLRRFQAAVVTIMAVAALGVGAVAFFTSFEAIRAYAKGSGGITPAHAWAVPLLVDSFIVIATGAELWLGVHPTRRAWWELAWPRALLAGAAMVSFVLNVAHAEAGDWAARGVAAIPPAALVLSVELLVLIARRAALARTHRLTTATQASDVEATATVVVRSDQATTRMVPTNSGRPALEATNRTNDHPTPMATGQQDATSRGGDQPRATSGAVDHQADATGDPSSTTTAAKATSAGQAGGGATYQRVRELYLGGMTVAAHIARELGVSNSYAQRTLRRVKADLARHQETPATGPARATTPERPEQATSDQDRDQAEVAARSHDHLTQPDPQRGDQVTGRAEAANNGAGRTTTSNGERHLVLVASPRDRDQREVER